jgi:hypothetical protein
VLKPTGLVLWDAIYFVGEIAEVLLTVLAYIVQCLLVYGAVVILVWWTRGRPPFGEFFATSPFTRFIHAGHFSKIAAQPNVGDEVDEGSSMGQPRPLSSPLAFFKSKSPLDDLFVTFALTKGLTQPLLQRDSTVDSESLHTTPKVADNDLEAGFDIEKEHMEH